MNREEARISVQEGKRDEVVKVFEKFGYSLSRESIGAKVSTFSTQEIYKKFLGVWNFIDSNSSDPQESMEVMRSELKAFMPSEIVDKPNSFDIDIPEYLKSFENPAQLFDELWEVCKRLGQDDLTIGIAWAAQLYISL